MEQILHQLRLVVSTIIYIQGLYIPGGAGFLPSTVVTLSTIFHRPDSCFRVMWPEKSLQGLQSLQWNWNRFTERITKEYQRISYSRDFF